MKWTDSDIQQEAISIDCVICGANAYRRCVTTGRFKNARTTDGLHKTRLTCAHKQLQRTAVKEAEEVAAKIVKVDLLNASPQLFCETLFSAAKVGVTDAAAERASRSDHNLAKLLCVREKYRYEHVRMLHEAYESGRTFMELRGEPTNMTWGETTERAGQTEHGSYRVRFTKGKKS